MASNGIKPGPVFPGPLGFPLRLRTLKSARSTHARILRVYGQGLIDHETFRNLIFGMSSFLSYLKTEVDQKFEDRLAVLETAILKKGGPNHEQKRIPA